jgi:hypothetical protein
LSKGSCSDNEEVSKNGTLPFEDGKAKETRVDSRTDEPRCQSKADNSIGAKIDELSKGSCSDNKEVSKNGTLTSEDAKAKETRVNSRLSGPMTDLAENCATPGSFIPSNTPTYETSVVPRRGQPDCCEEETLRTLVSGDSIFDDDDLVSNNAGLGGGEKLAPSKRKAITVDIDSNVPSSLSKGDRSNLIPDALPSKLGGNESCSKRIRYLLLNGSKWYQIKRHKNSLFNFLVCSVVLFIFMRFGFNNVPFLYIKPSDFFFFCDYKAHIHISVFSI